MSAISITKLYDFLCFKLGKETAENLTTFIETKIDNGLESQTHLATKEDLAKLSLATKEDIAKLSATTKEDIAKLSATTKEDIAKLSAATKEDIAKLSQTTKEEIGKLDTKISETKSEVIKWMFIFWTGQLLATVSFILLFLKK